MPSSTKNAKCQLITGIFIAECTVQTIERARKKRKEIEKGKRKKERVNMEWALEMNEFGEQIEE